MREPYSTLRSRLESFLSDAPRLMLDEFDRGYEKGINRAIDELEATSPFRPWQILGGACLAGGLAFGFCGHPFISSTVALCGAAWLLGEVRRG
jgi:hypothetical protein